MILYPTPQARFAVRQTDLVVLEVQAGRYSCLPGAGAAVAMARGAGRLEVFDGDLADLLCAAGLLSTDPPAAPADLEPWPAAPSRDLLDDEPSRPAPRDIAAIALAYGDMLRRFHGRGFGQLIATARRGRRGGQLPADASPSAAVRSQVAAFRLCQPWIPFQGDCLYRAFMLQRALRRRGEDARWVFGVQTWPFEAHCWLQIGDVVLDDAADRVAAFTPILVV